MNITENGRFGAFLVGKESNFFQNSGKSKRSNPQGSENNFQASKAQAEVNVMEWCPLSRSEEGRAVIPTSQFKGRNTQPDCNLETFRPEAAPERAEGE